MKNANQNTNSYLETARRAIEVEAKGLTALCGALDDQFIRAVETIERMKENGKGRLIITGMGKSGHVARKMAATLASTGTPSMFVHPGEASHGDLGMITEEDVVIALSKSGEAPELADIIAYTRRFAIPLIAITAQKKSSLGRYCDICLLLPNAAEACPNGLAPTTSTTMTMALGDALALTLLHNMNLTPEQFKVFHPGGKLGQKLLKVSELMDPFDQLPIIAPETTMDDALIVMTQRNLGCLIVMKDGAMCGIITDGDLKRHMSGNFLKKKASAILSAEPKTVMQDVLAVEAVDMMSSRFKQPITSLLVTDKKGALVGLIRLQECIKAGIV